MFPFVFKLWRYHGLPRIEDVPGISAPAVVSPSIPAASAREAEMDDIYQRAQLQKKWQESYLPRLWGSPHPKIGTAPRVILAADDGTPEFAAALKTAGFLARHWNAALAESTVTASADDVFLTASREGADWIVAGPALAETLVSETRLPILCDRNGSLADGVRRILIPVDGKAPSLAAVAEGLQWAHAFDAELLVLHVAESAADLATEHPGFLDALQAVRWDSVAHETRTGEGTVADAILAAAEEADLVIMVTKNALIAAEVVRRASKPVFLLHSEDA